jgi:two-component system, cell cycle sensor histidine kinase and response regulator CckA
MSRQSASMKVLIRGTLAETAARNSEVHLRQLAENIGEVFWMIDLTKREVLYVSPAYETVWGRTCESLLEQPQSFFEAVHPDDYARVLGAQQSELPYELEYRIIRPDFSVRWIRNRAFPVRGATGQVIRIAGLAEDVTEKRQLEIQMRQSQKMQAITRLAGGMAHDFNNLLSVIFGHSALLAAGSPSQERLRDSVAEINRAAERAAALTGQLLALGGQQSVEPKVLDLGSVLSESRSLLQRLIGEDVRLTMILSPNLSRVKIDPSQINQILINLVVNASDAMPQGGELTIETRDVELEADSAMAHRETSAGRYVLLAVSDTGCGMAPEVQAQIFEPFFSGKRDHPGLGLWVVDGILQQNGGHLALASHPGLGTTFSIYLPAVKEPERSPQSPLPQHLPRNETILLVEDEDPVREVNALLLESLGYRVLQVSDAEEALKLAQNEQVKIDLLFTDVIMPGMSGRELAEAFRSLFPNIKILFQSGYTDDIVVRHGILQTEVPFLQKPFSIDTLAKKIRNLFEQN